MTLVVGVSRPARRRHGRRWRGDLGAPALRTEDVVAVGEEAAAHQRRVAAVTHEAVAVPVALLKRDELRATQTGDSLDTLDALLGKQLSEAVGAVRLVLP